MGGLWVGGCAGGWEVVLVGGCAGGWEAVRVGGRLCCRLEVRDVGSK